MTYKRPFGRENDKALAASARECQFCHRAGGVCSVPVFFRQQYDCPAHVVCYKTYCVFCGKIQYFENGRGGKFYAFFMPKMGGKGIFTAIRDFFIPREVYQTNEGKADVGLKVRLIKALLRLQIKEPQRKEFFMEEICEESKK